MEQILLLLPVAPGIVWIFLKCRIKRENKKILRAEQKRLDMIHRTRELEKSELGEVKTECECSMCKPKPKPPALIPPGTEVPGWAKSYVSDPLLDDAQKMFDSWSFEHQLIEQKIERIKAQYSEAMSPPGKTKYCIKCNINFTDPSNPTRYLCFKCRPDKVVRPKPAQIHKGWQRIVDPETKSLLDLSELIPMEQ